MDTTTRLTPLELRERGIAREKIAEAAANHKKSTRQQAERIKQAKRAAALKITAPSSSKAGGGKKSGRASSRKAAGNGEEAMATAAAPEADDANAAAPAVDGAAEAGSEAPAPPVESAEAAAARAEEEREAARERIWAEREQQRREVMTAIVEEERRLRQLAQQRRERLAAEKRQQKELCDAAFDGEYEVVARIVSKWCDDCFSDLIGAKLDCTDQDGNSALSEAAVRADATTACGGHADICRLLLRHGADVNKRSEHGRTPLWRAAFMDKREAARCLLEHGGDTRIPSNNLDLPDGVAPSAELRELLGTWDSARTEQILAQRAVDLADQWVPPERDVDDEPCGEPGYSVSITLTRLADALDTVARDTERYSLVADLGGKATTFFSYRDVNMAMAYRPSDADPETLRKLLLGALRFGKPFVMDMLSMPLTRDAVDDLLDPVLPGLLGLLLNRRILREEHYAKLLRVGDEDAYTDLTLWQEKNLIRFHFILLTRLPVPPQWCVDNLFVIKVASTPDAELAQYG